MPNYSEARQKLLIHYSGFVVALVIAAFLLLLFPTGGTSSSTGNLRDYATVFDGLTGMLGAVALSLLIARLDSRLINLSPSLIFLFFAYAAIQPLLVVFELKAEVFRTIETTILTAAFFLKICFFLVTLKALRNGNIHIYFACFPFLHKRVDSIFENQFEIRTLREGDHSYVVSIWKKNHLVYLPETSFGSRGECDNWVHRFRELMNEEKNYDRGEESGTHWLKVVDPLKRKLVCESIALRSVEDADHLREESMEKIPHCKYDRT